jgi:hypothetical protein
MRAAYGVSKQEGAVAATRDALDQALSRLGGNEHVFAAFVFWGVDHDATEIAETLRTKLPDVPTIGCSTDGEITSAGLSVDSVTLMLLASPRMRAKAHVIPNLSEDSERAGIELAKALHDDEARVLMLLPDGLTGNGSAIIRGAQEILGRQFVIAGGTAGDRGRFVKTFQCADGKAHTDALIGLMLYSPTPLELGYGVMSGWRPIGIAKEVTHAEANTVYEIEGETALDMYSRFLGDKASQLPGIGVEYPFALVDRYGEVDTKGIREGESYFLMRAPMVVDREKGAVTFAAEIPQGSRIKMTRGKSDEVISASREAASRSLEGLGGPPDAVFFFSCMARKVVLGRRTNLEITAAQEVLGENTPMIGFYTYGEIANCGETFPMCRFHNETATFLAIREGV